MTYYEAYSKCETREQMEEAMKHDVEVAMFLGSNPDRLKAIEDATNRVAEEKGWVDE